MPFANYTLKTGGKTKAEAVKKDARDAEITENLRLETKADAVKKEL